MRETHAYREAKKAIDRVFSDRGTSIEETLDLLDALAEYAEESADNLAAAEAVRRALLVGFKSRKPSGSSPFSSFSRSLSCSGNGGTEMRYQVNWTEIRTEEKKEIFFATKRGAEDYAKTLRADRGVRDVFVWDTEENPLSGLLRLK
jgi:hypothetical protein